ncbi:MULTISPECIES: PAQR family membrane homeostasis protein TrhA [unclassified Modestobacter]|uniref:PAQR family membrane homeostasis protein TrhA n=1 Tax=unclassified Modestobacter TaxID=2643866 RepID=UPI0022AA2852|nr:MULTISPECIES: hemolysin III family protein [unclassified Modestobacter]MCZ2810436.1 hemolysin III family protein [Modestobacter sp. VKM Ac-2979]MCZ2841922.1 hemolysin III family protein [Modestobacter sp. VKM Ac-2980]MCZ2847023.1 hemolysin III family protein [Modestobacter sp. VKM Ac-2978]
MSVSSDHEDHARVTADGAEIEAPAGEAVAAVHAEGERVESVERQGEWPLAEDGEHDHPDTRPRMRGWLHLFAFFGSVIAGAVLIPLAAVQGARAGWSVALYCVTILGLFGVSALYHRRRWSPRGWQLMKRADHSMIFVFIAGTYTPFALLAVPEPTGRWLLALVWAGAVLGVALKVAWPHAPRWLGVPIYLALGWAAVFVLVDILQLAGVTALVLLCVGGLLYSVGAIAYASKRPNPWPGTFGYHEVFHALTIVAALCHYIAIYFVIYRSPLA